MNSRQFERDMDQLERNLEDGVISQREYDKQMREIERDYRDAAQEAACDAYDREMENW